MYIKRVELTNFKSFGGTTDVPLLPGFTVISGPNGSGKSNILDALLFALGLSSSKGMRAERLPDLVNQTQSSRGKGVIEASVTATFALEAGDIQQMLESAAESAESNDPETSLQPITEWTVMRKLRVTQQGTYTSSYSLNAQPCTLTELHEQLQKVHVYPEGYNVVLQGDVTSIISMNPRERREIIDELAGVAAFDRKINQAKEKLDAVKEREERFRIVERELTTQRDKLSQDRIKAERYQRLKLELQDKSQWEAVLGWQAQAKQADQIQLQITAGDQTTVELAERLTAMAEEIRQATILLDQLNRHVKALGEDELLALQATLATREAELRQLQRQQQELTNQRQETAKNLERSQQEIQEHLRQLEGLGRERQRAESEDLVRLRAERDQANQALEQQREAASTIASASDAWIQEQTALRREIEALQKTLEPQRTEQARLQERTSQLRLKIQEQTNALTAVTGEIAARQTQRSQVEAQVIGSIQALTAQEQSLSASERELQVQQETQARLLNEQRDKQRQLDKLEAQAQIIRESQGTGLSKILTDAGLPGICGLVAELGRVDAQYQLALEIAAGARLSYLIVEDDSIAAAGIELLKRQRAGRATFLPLNKIRAGAPANLPKWNRPEGFIDHASSLIDCDDRFREVFSYVFGNTVVFASLQAARRQMGQYRIVTLDGELLETSGAMTGGSISNRQGTLHFGRVEAGESAEAVALRERLQEISQVLQHCERQIAKAVVEIKEKMQALSESRQLQRSVQIQIEQLQKELVSLIAQEGQIRAQLGQNQQELTAAEARLFALERDFAASRISLSPAARGDDRPRSRADPQRMAAAPRRHPRRRSQQLAGWAYDPDDSKVEISVAVYINGGGIAWFPTGVSRQDVNNAYGITGNHGYNISVPYRPGTHLVEVYAINVKGGSGNPRIGSRVFTM